MFLYSLYRKPCADLHTLLTRLILLVSICFDFTKLFEVFVKMSVSKADYLKKYLSDGEKLKKKKKKSKSSKTSSKVKIIDDDGVNDYRNSDIEEEILFGGEDAPQVVEVHDEGIQNKPDFVKNTWKSVGSKIDESKSILGDLAAKRKHVRERGPPAVEKSSPDRKSKSKLQDNLPPRKRESTSPTRRDKKDSFKRDRDTSPPRRRTKSRFSDCSPPPSRPVDVEPSPRPRNDDNSPPRKGVTKESDHSPRRKVHSPARQDVSPPQKIDDNSPPRRYKNKEHSPPRRFKEPHYSPPRRDKGKDNSPPRRDRGKDISPPRRDQNKDNSPPRRYQGKDNSPPRRAQGKDHSPPRRYQHKDSSPPNRNQGKDSSPPRKSQVKDHSPPRKYQHKDHSPPRRFKNPESPPPRKSHGKDNSPPRRSQGKDNSPPRRNPFKTESNDSPRQQKMSDGKLSGLQNAVNLKTEIKNLKSREDEIFEKMSSEFSGRDAEIQTRKTSRKRVQESPTKLLEKEKRNQENKAKYTRWGKGLKQIEALEQKVQDFTHEASKPLARYSNDEDLEEMLKQQERSGDPMLQYMRQQKEKKKDPKTLSMPTYQGPYPENRFNIRPGYRWDGLDRSNGYEKKLFDIQNTKRADRDDSYKYSTEDM